MRGIRQGDPVSGFLFNIAVEILARQIKNSNRLTGIRLNTNTEVRISQYADDTILFLDGSERSLNGATEELAKFSSESGLKLNWEKTSGLFIGSQNSPDYSSNELIKKIKWVDEIKILGIYFTRNVTNITDNNLEKKLSTLENEIAQWKRRYITPIGKITVIKSLLLSKLVHILVALPNPSRALIKTIERKLYNFLWNNKPDPVKRLKVIQRYEHDGLKMVDLASFIQSLKLSWLKRLTIYTTSGEPVARPTQLDPFQLLMYGTAQLKVIKSQIKNVFWREVVSSLIQFNELLDLKPEQIMREQLWFSDYTKFETSKVTQWDKRGLRFIGDLFNKDNGNLLTREEIKTQYRISMTFLCYESLIRSLPEVIRNATCIPYETPNIPFKLQFFLNRTDIARYFYSLLINELRKKCNLTTEILRNKWIRDVGSHNEGSLLPVTKATKSMRFLYLHYRISNRIITTNKFLHIIKIAEESSCTFCKLEIETITHIFWNCRVTQTFLQNINTELCKQYKIRFRFSARSWFFLHGTDALETLLITIVKAVIHKARNNGEKPSIAHVMNLIKVEAQKEQLASRLNNTSENFEKKWKTLRHILSP